MDACERVEQLSKPTRGQLMSPKKSESRRRTRGKQPLAVFRACPESVCIHTCVYVHGRKQRIFKARIPTTIPFYHLPCFSSLPAKLANRKRKTVFGKKTLEKERKKKEKERTRINFDSVFSLTYVRTRAMYSTTHLRLHTYIYTCHYFSYWYSIENLPCEWPI